MAASTVSPPHPLPQPTVTRPSAQNQGGSTGSAGGDNSASGTTARDSQPTHSSFTAPGTGLVVDKHV